MAETPSEEFFMLDNDFFFPHLPFEFSYSAVGTLDLTQQI